MLDHGSQRAPTHLVPRKTFFPAQVLFRPRPAIINTTCTSLKFHSDSQAWWGSSEKEDSKVGKGPPLLLGDDERRTHTQNTSGQNCEEWFRKRERKSCPNNRTFSPSEKLPSNGCKVLALESCYFFAAESVADQQTLGSRGPKKAPVRNRQNKQLKLFALQNIQ